MNLTILESEEKLPNETKVISYQSEKSQILDAPQYFSYVQNPLEEIGNSTSAIIHIKNTCSNVCCKGNVNTCCGNSFIYNTFLVTPSGPKYLFRNTVRIEPSCGCCIADPLNSNIVYNSYKKSSSQEFFEVYNGISYTAMLKSVKCCCNSIREILMKVMITPENRPSGIVKIRGCCEKCRCDCKCPNCDCDCKCPDCKCKCPDCECKLPNCDIFIDCLKGICKKPSCPVEQRYSCEILDSNKDLKYFIYYNACNCGLTCCICSRRKCGLRFSITDLNENEVGYISGILDRSLGEFFHDSYSYEISFPEDSTPELKLTLLHAVYAIDTICLF